MELMILDVGCKFGVHPSFLPILDLARFHMIDADAEEVKFLRHHYKGRPNLEFYNFFASSHKGDGGNVELLNYRHPGGSSIYQPDYENSYWSTLRPGSGEILSTSNVASMALDSVFQGQDVDFIKVDVEGAELEVLEGASSMLQDSVLGVRVEVLLNSIYKDCDETFSSCRRLLEDHGFQFLFFDRFATNAYRPYSDIIGDPPFGQLIGADAIFVKSPDLILQSKNLRSITFLSLFAVLSGAIDLSFHLLRAARAIDLYPSKEYEELSDYFAVLEEVFARHFFANQDRPGHSLAKARVSWQSVFTSPFFEYGEFYRRYPLS